MAFTLTETKQRSKSIQAQFLGGAAVSPSDTVDLTNPATALWVGNLGNVTVITLDGSTVTFTNFSGWLPGVITRVKATGTTATGITAVWQ